MVNVSGFRVSMETHLRYYLWGIFWIRLIEVELAILNVGSNVPQVGLHEQECGLSTHPPHHQLFHTVPSTLVARLSLPRWTVPSTVSWNEPSFFKPHPAGHLVSAMTKVTKDSARLYSWRVATSPILCHQLLASHEFQKTVWWSYFSFRLYFVRMKCKVYIFCFCFNSLYPSIIYWIIYFC